MLSNSLFINDIETFLQTNALRIENADSTFYHENANFFEEISNLLKIGNKFSNTLAHSYTFLLLVKSKYDLKRFSESLEIALDYISFRNSNLLTETKQDLEVICRMWQFIALIHLQKENYFESMIAIRKTLAIMPNDFESKEKIFDTVAQIFFAIGSYSESEHFFTQSIKIKRVKKDLMGLSISLGGLGQVFGKNSEYIKAYQKYRIAYKLSSRIKNEFGKFLINTYILELFNSLSEEKLLFDLSSKIQFSFDLNLKIQTLIAENDLFLNQNEKDPNSPLYIRYYLERLKSRILSHDFQETELDILKNRIEKLSPRNISSFNRLLSTYSIIKKDYLSAIEYLNIASELCLLNREFLESAMILFKKSKLEIFTSNSKAAEDSLIKGIKICEDYNLESLSSKLETDLKKLNELIWVKIKFQRFLGVDVSSELLTMGRQRAIFSPCVSFCDLRDFTSISEKLGEENLIDFLNDYFNSMTKVIHYNQGYVDKYIGDAILYINYSKSVSKSFCGDAIFTALNLLEELSLLNIRFKFIGLPTLKIGIGIHKGPLVSGMIGPISRREYTIIGDTVNTASRLEGVSKKYGFSIICTEEVISGISEKETNELEFLELDSVILKGKKDTTKLFTVFRKNSQLPIMQESILLYKKALDRFKNLEFIEAEECLNKLHIQDFEKIKNIMLIRISELKKINKDKIKSDSLVLRLDEK